MSIAPDIGIADGASIETVDVTIDSTNPPPNRKIDLTTTLGSFLPSGTSVSVVAAENGVGRVQLRSPSEAGTAIVTANSAGVILSKEINFLPANPTRLQLHTTGFSLKQGLANSVDVTAMLLRSIGTPTPGSLVTFTADTTGGITGDFGQFAGRTIIATTSAVTNQFTAGPTSYTGNVVLRASVSRDGKTTASDSTLIAIIK